MPEVTGRCPMCEAELVVTHLRCQSCGTGLEGVFHLNKFDRLSREQLRFVDVFVKNRGVIRDVERELNISYPTVRSRLDDVIRALGYDASGDTSTDGAPAGGTGGVSGPAGGAGSAGEPSGAASDPARRRQILDRLAAGEITAEQAVAELRGAGAGAASGNGNGNGSGAGNA